MPTQDILNTQRRLAFVSVNRQKSEELVLPGEALNTSVKKWNLEMRLLHYTMINLLDFATSKSGGMENMLRIRA